MSVEPGFGGQKYIEGSEKRVEEVRKYLNKDCLIQIDGGINEETILKAKACDLFVSGSFLNNAKEKYQKLLDLINEKN